MGLYNTSAKKLLDYYKKFNLILQIKYNNRRLTKTNRICSKLFR
jgi:hypothetical protein